MKSTWWWQGPLISQQPLYGMLPGFGGVGRKQPIIVLYFESETVCLLRFYNLEAWTHDPVSLLIVLRARRQVMTFLFLAVPLIGLWLTCVGVPRPGS